jgi:hypothetical protein
MSACPKIDPLYDSRPIEDDEQTRPWRDDDTPDEAPQRSSWWHRAVHLMALLGLLGLCVILSVVGLLWFSLAIEPR